MTVYRSWRCSLTAMMLLMLLMMTVYRSWRGGLTAMMLLMLMMIRS